MAVPAAAPVSQLPTAAASGGLAPGGFASPSRWPGTAGSRWQSAHLHPETSLTQRHTSTQRPGSCLNSVQRAMGLHAQVSSPLHRVKCRQKGGHVLTRMSSGEACTAAFQTQRPRVTTEGGLNVKAPDGQQSLRQLRPRPTAFLTKVSLHCEGAGLFASEITCL